MSALADPRVAEFLNTHCVSTYMKVGTFQIIGGAKVGGNVASYFCLHDGSVLHAVPGPVNADKLLSEARWATETRKSARTLSTDLVSGKLNYMRFKGLIRQSHLERFRAEGAVVPGRGRRLFGPTMTTGNVIPSDLPRHLSKQAQAHWLLTQAPLERIDRVYPFVWQRILNERLSGLPVAKR